MAVDLQELLLGIQARGMELSANGHAQCMDWHDRITIKKFDQVGLIEAAAAKDLGKMGGDPRYLPNTQPG